MYKKKVYGSYRREVCPFCQGTATTFNEQKIPVCHKHKTSLLGEMKCACGEYLDIQSGKFGAFFSCMNCGPQNLQKIFAINKIEDVKDKTNTNTNSNNNGNSDNYSSLASKKKSKQVSMESPYISKKRNYSGNEETVNSDDPRYF